MGLKVTILNPNDPDLLVQDIECLSRKGWQLKKSDLLSNLMDRLTGKEAVHTSTSCSHILELIDQK